MRKLLFIFLLAPILCYGGGLTVSSSGGTATNLTVVGAETNNLIVGSTYNTSTIDMTYAGLGGVLITDNGNITNAGVGIQCLSAGTSVLATPSGVTVNAGTGTCTLQGAAGVAINSGTFAPRSINYLTTQVGANTTLNNGHHQVFITATGKTITLPTAVGILGREYFLKLIVAGSSTIATTSSQTIDGATTYSLSAQWKYVRVTSDGANWEISGNN